MSENTLKWAIGILAGLAVLYAVVLLVGSGGRGPTAEGELHRRLADLAADTAESVTLAGPTDTIELARSEETWTVNGFQTETNAVDRFWTAVADARVGDLIGSNPGNHRRLGVAADSTWTLTFRRESQDAVTILVGKAGPSFTSAYVRLPDEDDVYLVEGGLRGAATRRLEDWRDRTIVAVDTAAVDRVVVERDGTSRTLTRSAESWLVDGEPADSAAVRSLFQELASLEATGFAEADAPFEGEDQRSVLVQDAEGDTLAVVEIRADEGQVLARSPGNPVVFRLSSFRADRLAPEPDSLTGDPAEPGS